MIKISSLDFLNREVFDIDVMAKDGTVLFSAGEPITPEVILNLYFKEIYVEQDYCALEEEETSSVKKTEEDMMQQVAALKLDSQLETNTMVVAESIEQVEDKEVEAEIAIKQTEEKADETLKFDEEQAKRIAEYSCMLGKIISMPEKDLKELELAAYYHKVGRKMFTNADLAQPDFKKRQAEASYNIMLKEMKFPEKVAEVAKFYLKRYNTIDFKLDKEFCSNIPYSHIVSIVSYYDEQLEISSKEEALAKMLQSGGNRFNIFVLHKFINMMRENNG